MTPFSKLLVVLLLLTTSITLFSQRTQSPQRPQGDNGGVKVKILDAQTKQAVEFVTVYVSKDGTIEKAQFGITDQNGEALIKGVRKGEYVLKAELLGYVMHSQKLVVNSSKYDVETILIKPDLTMLEEAKVSAVGNPMVVKEDTIEYNAASYKISDNDMLEDLLKKLPGVEVDEDGNVTANGEAITKITIDGKTFFLDDPTLASKNIPAKIVEKVKVVKKKSEQAAFTGIDDGEEEPIIDLSIVPGMMRGWFGNVSGGGGLDTQTDAHDARWQGAGIVGQFTDNTQLAVIVNGNNTNNRGFTDVSGGMKGGGGSQMSRGGGSQMSNGKGVTTSWMGGVHANTHIGGDKDRMIGGSYMYGGSESLVKQDVFKTTFLENGSSMLSDDNSETVKFGDNHNFGADFEYKFNEKTSLMFKPRANIGCGRTDVHNDFNSLYDTGDKINEGYSDNSTDMNYWKTNGTLFLRHRIGETKGRTISLMSNYSLSGSDSQSNQYSETVNYQNRNEDVVDQRTNNDADSYSVTGRLSYTEPLGRNFFLEAAYKVGFVENNSEKLTYTKDNEGKYSIIDNVYSNKIKNTFINHDAQINFQKQTDKLIAQIGFGVQPASTKSVTHLFTQDKDTVLSYNTLNWSPSAMLRYKISKTHGIMMRYSGYTNQPSITQLMPVADNSNPIRVNLGNAELLPEFAHSLRMYYNFTNRETFFSLNAYLRGSYVMDDIVNASWYNTKGVQFIAPINSEEASYSANAYVVLNSPIAKSNFSVSSSTGISLNHNTSYTGFGETESIYEIMDELLAGRTTSYHLSEKLVLKYRNDFIETTLGGKVSYSDASYSIESQEQPSTWTNSVIASINATIPGGLEIKTDIDHIFYIGFEDGYNDAQTVWNAQISKLLFKNSATLTLKMYDILNQAKSVYRQTADNYFQDISNNTLGQYIMLSFTYRFGSFPDFSNNNRRHYRR